MESFSGIAQVQFANLPGILCGPITHRDRREISIAVQDAPDGFTKVSPGLTAQIVVAVNHAFYRASAHSLEDRSGHLRLALDSPVERIRRRRAYRHPCNLEAAVRPLESACASIWHHGVAFEIGYGGMALLLRPLPIPTDRFEVRFTLPESSSGLRASARLPVTSPTCPAYHRLTLDCMQATARVVSRRTTAYGHERVGLAFVSMPPDDQMRLFTCTAGQPGELETY